MRIIHYCTYHSLPERDACSFFIAKRREDERRRAERLRHIYSMNVYYYAVNLGSVLHGSK